MSAAARSETGAMDEQISQATVRRIRRLRDMGWDETVEADIWFAEKVMNNAAQDLVPPGFVIALAEHVVDAADREAIGRAHYAMTQVLSQRDNDFYGISPDDLARLERLGSGGEETT